MTTSPSLAELRERVQRLEGRPATQPVATHPALSGLVQLQTGGIYTADSATLTGLLMAGPSGEGAWCGVVGSSVWGLEALGALGVRLDRCVLVPDPQDSWLEVTAALIDVLGVVVVSPPASARKREVSETDASRVAARLRKRGGVLLVRGSWPRADARLSLTDVRWTGVGRGHGHLQARQATVEVHRGAPGSGAMSAPGSGAMSAPGSGAMSAPGSGAMSAPGSGAIGTATVPVTRRLWMPDIDQVVRPVTTAPVEVPVPLRGVG